MKLRDLNGLDRIILVYLCAVQLFAFQANLLRLSGLSYFQAEYFDHVFLGNLLIAMISLMFAFRAKLVEAPFLVMMLIFCVLILSVGVFKSNDDPIAGLRYFVLPVFAYMLLLGRKYVMYFYTSKLFWLLVSGAHIIGLLYYFGTLFGTVYPGVGVQSIAYAAIFFFCNGHFILFAIAVLAILLEGKRSIMLSLVLTLIFLRMIRYQTSLRLLYFAGACFAAIAIGSIGLMYLAEIEGNSTINRINLLNPYSNNYDLLLGSSGRLGELISFFGDYALTDLLFGSGAGFQYEWSLGYASEQDGSTKGYFHLSAANYLVAGGVFGVLVFASIALMPFRARHLRISFSAKHTAFGMGFFSIVQSSFGFNLATDMMSWIFILGPGMLLAHKTLDARIKSDHSIVDTVNRKRTS